jgi:hypothetical protein
MEHLIALKHLTPTTYLALLTSWSMLTTQPCRFGVLFTTREAACFTLIVVVARCDIEMSAFAICKR